jgi:GT2 family glycosyltransferase
MVTIPKVVVTVLNYNRHQDTIDCINSLLKCSYPQFDILVVDNGSTDGSFGRIKAAHPGIEMMSTHKNLGYTGGVNICIELAKARLPEYIMVLNNDTLVEPDFLNYLVQALELHHSAAAASGTILAEHDRETIWYAGGKMIPWRGLAVHCRKGSKLDRTKLGFVRKVTFVTGCMILFRTSMIDVAGLEDERFFMYLDDIELSFRIQKRGLDLLYVPESVIYHKVLNDTDSALKLYYSVRNRLLFITVALTGPVGTIAALYFLLVICVKILYWKLTNPSFYKAATFGIHDFFGRTFYEGRGISEFGF